MNIQTAFEMFSCLFDKSSMVKAGSTPLNPTSAKQLRAHHGQRNDTQKFLADQGRQMDKSRGVVMQIPVVGRYQHHNCLPWRNDSCTVGPSPGASHVHPIVTPPTRIIQSQSYVPVPFPPGNTASRHLSPVPENTSFPEDLYSPSVVYPKVLTTSESAMNPAAVTAEAMELRIQDYLLVYFLDGGHFAPETERRNEALRILEEQFQARIILNVPSHELSDCEEFKKMESVVERCLKVMYVDGISLVPVLSNEGKELVVHVCHG
jgi:hypothetical protein